MNLSLYSEQHIRQCEHIAMAQCDISDVALMQRAADAAFNHIEMHFSAAQRIAICCGQGNNGGDGYVLARLLKQAGYDVFVIHLDTTPQASTSVASDAIAKAIASDVEMRAFAHVKLTDFANADLIVDALLGIGVHAAVRAPVADVISLINQAQCPILALDLPSGLHPDTGQHQGVTVLATQTITFIAGKVGLLTGEGMQYAGRVFVADLDLPTTIFNDITPVAIAADWHYLRSQLPSRARHIHKGHVGHVLVIGGNYGMGGAAALAAQAAYRVGAGLVSVATRAQHVAPLLSHMPELMVHAIDELSDIEPLLERTTVIVLGPGLGDDNWAKALFQCALESNKVCIIDADGLNQLAQTPQPLPNAILTPHPGEAARLLASTTEIVQQDRLHALADLVQHYQATVVLKGAGTCISAPDVESAVICPAGNPGMASGGMGDLLSGIIAGLYAQGLSAHQAACLGVCAHGYAGDLAAKQGQRGLVASDLLPYLRQIMG